MPTRLRQLRGEPLLQPPGSRPTPWAEIGSLEEAGMRKAMHALLKDDTEYGSAEIGASLKTLGFDVDGYAVRAGGRLLGRLHDELYYQPVEAVAHYLVNLSVLGLKTDDVVPAFRERAAKAYKEFKPQFTSIPHRSLSFAYDMRELGLEAPKTGVKEQELREVLGLWAGRGEWTGYADMLAKMKGLGYGVDDEARSNKADLRNHLQSLARKRSWADYASYAANLKRLGLLTPHSTEAEDEMPPVKRFRQ